MTKVTNPEDKVVRRRGPGRPPMSRERAMELAVKRKVCVVSKCNRSTARLTDGEDIAFCPHHAPDKYRMRLPDPELCGARTKSGTCHQTAGLGTAHEGYGSCSRHGGGLPNVTKSAFSAQSRAEASALLREMPNMGIPRETDPHEAVKLCIAITTGEIDYASAKIVELDPEAVTWVKTSVKERPQSYGKEGESSTSMVEETTVENTEAVNIWIQVRWDAMDRLARFSKMAVDMGVAERQVRVAEGMALALSSTLKAILDGLKLTPAQQKAAPALVRTHLAALVQQQDIIEA